MKDNTNYIDYPTFLTGNAASGTTLLRNLLDGHDDLMVFPVEMNLRAYISRSGAFDESQIDRFLRSGPTTGINSLRYSKANLDSGKRDYRDIDYEQFTASVKKNWDGKSARSLQRSLIQSFKRSSIYRDKPVCRWVEKTHGNEHFIRLFARWYPNMKVIHIVRDPFDNYSSYKKKSEKGGGSVTPVSFSAFWSLSLEEVKSFKKMYPDKILMIRYEQLLRKPEQTLNTVCNFLGISYSEELMVPTTYGIPWSGNSQKGTQFETISTKPIGTHKNGVLKPEDLDMIGFALSRYKRFFYFSYSANWYGVWKFNTVKEFFILLAIRFGVYKHFKYIKDRLKK